MNRTILVGLMVCLEIATAPPETFARKWTDKSGMFSIEAEFVSEAEGVVTLKRDDGQTIRLALDKLSTNDQEVVHAVAQAISAAPKSRVKNSAPKVQDPFVSGAVKLETMETTEAPTDVKGTSIVLAEGAGTTPEEALKDAFRNAVRQVVGEVVDAETLVKNDELVKDQVLTYSDAFIPKHRKLSEKKEGGLYRITIQAMVERRSLIQKLTTAKIVVKTVDGQSLFGNVVSQLDADKSAIALIRKALDGFPGNCIETKILGEPKVLSRGEQTATIQVNVQFQANHEAYRAFAVRLERTLAAVAIDKGEFSYSPKPYDDFNVAKFMPKAVGETSHGNFTWAANKFTVALATQADATCERLTFSYFNLAEELRDPFLDAGWQQIKCKLSLLDPEGTMVASDLFPDNNSCNWGLYDPTLIIGFGGYAWQGYDTSISKCKSDKLDAAYGHSRWMVISPVFFDQISRKMTHRPKLVFARQISLPLSDIKRLKEMRCELLFEKQPVP